MANIEDIGKLFKDKRKELGLTQAQLGERVGVSKSEISKIESGRGLTFSTIKKLSEALGVTAAVELKPRPASKSSLNIIHFLVMGMGMFARRHSLSKKDACNYLSRFKGLDFTIRNYEVEHQLSLEDCVDDMTAICIKNGGVLARMEDRNFEFLVEYITSQIAAWMVDEEGMKPEEALVNFHNSKTFDKLCDKKTKLYIESPGYVYEMYKSEAAGLTQ